MLAADVIRSTLLWTSNSRMLLGPIGFQEHPLSSVRILQEAFMPTVYFDRKDGVPIRDRAGLEFPSTSNAIEHSKELARRLSQRTAAQRPHPFYRCHRRVWARRCIENEFTPMFRNRPDIPRPKQSLYRKRERSAQSWSSRGDTGYQALRGRTGASAGDRGPEVRIVSERPTEAFVPLRRRLGLPLLVLYGTGITVGAGIYVLIGAVAGHAGIYAPWSFVLAAAVMA